MNDDEDIVTLSLDTRYFYVSLWPWLDRQALIEEVPLSIRSKLFPREEIPLANIENWIGQLTRQGPSGRPRLVRVKWRGKNLLYCPTLKRHGRIYNDEPEMFRVPEELLKQAREAVNVFIDENGDAVDPPAPPSPPPRDPGGPPRDLGDSPSQFAPSSASAPVSTSVSASASVPASVPAHAQVQDTGPGPGAGIGLRPGDTGPGAGSWEAEPFDFAAPELAPASVAAAIDAELGLEAAPEPADPPAPPSNVIPFRQSRSGKPADPVSAPPRAPDPPRGPAPATRTPTLPKPLPPRPQYAPAPPCRPLPQDGIDAGPEARRLFRNLWGAGYRPPRADQPVTPRPEEASA